MSVIPVVLSGGSGTRLWPLSRKQYPKQLLNLTGGTYTMLQETIIRTKHLLNPIIVCKEDQLLTNSGKLPFELIDVQSGSYLGEDDIVRFEDNFWCCD